MRFEVVYGTVMQTFDIRWENELMDSKSNLFTVINSTETNFLEQKQKVREKKRDKMTSFVSM